MPPNYNQIFGCLDELERELLRLGAERCEHLQQQSQLSAIVLLLLRSLSLLRSLPRLYRSQCLDSFDAVRRAFFESWQLAFQFRMENSRGEIGRWLAQVPDSWSANLQRLDHYVRRRGNETPDIGRQYGALSELAHPMRIASENSAALITNRLGVADPADRTLAEAMANLEGEAAALLYRLVWLVLDRDPAFVDLGVNEANLPRCVRFAAGYPHVRPPPPANVG